ncbi:hypothetical protein [Methylomagnum ishizawai]|uniref:hypothetical protein n=1 Tax=Methylomagnum ishizawai TaxID=1760988 RepID=UPI001C32EBFF|nr:hypothetical protein [Methylomagnum ishizawai]BBL74035.1 hypothetical protein MishRS11D_11330 [Methylomagnum ishizawai]
MKRLCLILAVLPMLPACTRQAQPNKGPTLPPLSTVAASIAPGMNLQEAEKKLSGHKPALMFTSQDGQRGVWELNERETNPRTNAIHAYRLLLQFDAQGKLQRPLLSECQFPDQETKGASSTPSTLCYRRLLLPFEKPVVYDALKRLLLNSNFQIEHSELDSGIITANGMQPTKDEDEVMYMKVSINFSPRAENTTELVMAATFNVVEKQMVWVQIGGAGINLPMPLPFQKTEEWADTGLATPKFYMNFYDALEQLLASEFLRYQAPPPQRAEVKAAPPPSPRTDAPEDTEDTNPEGASPDDIAAGPIDSPRNMGRPPKKPAPRKAAKSKPIDAADAAPMNLTDQDSSQPEEEAAPPMDSEAALEGVPDDAPVDAEPKAKPAKHASSAKKKPGKH